MEKAEEINSKNIDYELDFSNLNHIMFLSLLLIKRAKKNIRIFTKKNYSYIRRWYKSLTTDSEQRKSYRAHIINAIQNSLAPEKARAEAGEDPELANKMIPT